MARLCVIVGLVCLAMALVCVQPSSSLPNRYTDTSCKGTALNYVDCRSCCKRQLKFKGAFMDWDGCYCHNELHRGDPKEDSDW